LVPPETIEREAAPFREVTAEVGIEFRHEVSRDRRFFFPEIMSPGAAFLDFDQDGRLDCYLINSGTWGDSSTTGDPIRNGPTNRLYRQQEDGRFVDVTAGSGLDDRGFGMGVAIGDINNDSYPDVYVTNYGPDRLYLNQCDGTFLDVTIAAGIDNDRWSMSACFFDYDRDGWLDLFVTNYIDYQPFQPCHDASGRLDYCNPSLFPKTADKLYRNLSGRVAAADANSEDRRQVRFADVSVAAGIAAKVGAGLGVVCADFNGDDWPDIYVANDGQANFAWINRHDGTFQEEAVLSGIAYDGLGRGQGSMGLAVADLNNDGKLDLLATHLEGESNALYLTRDGSGFQESSRDWGLAEVSFPLTGFGVSLIDIEHDGDLDIAVVNGRVRRSVTARQRANDPSRVGPGGQPATPVLNDDWAGYGESNQLFINDGTGRFSANHFVDNPFCSPAEISRGLAYGDIDNDGDIDLLITNVNGPARLYRNESRKQGHWLMVRVVVKEWGGRDAYGALITVIAQGKRWRRLANPGSSYLTSNDPRVHFGIGQATHVDSIEVQWPDGSREEFAGCKSDQFVVLTRGEGDAVAPGETP